MFSITQLVNDTLDLEYAKTAGNMLAQIDAVSNAPNSPMQRSLKKLDEEAARLDNDDKRMTYDNAQLQDTLGEYQRTFETDRALIQLNDDAIQQTAISIAIVAVTAKVFLSLSSSVYSGGGNPISAAALTYYGSQIAKSGIPYTIPTAIDFVTGYVNTQAWADRMNGWASGYADVTRKTLIDGIANGWGPKYTAAQLRQYAEKLPYSAAENITRTLQLTAYRDASAAMELINGQYIEGKIRIARLDDRTCLSCIAQHGTQLKAGERVDDHYRGRCTEFYQVVGGPKYPEMMQADSKPGQRNFVQFQTGPDWFNSLSPERQAQQVSFLKSPAKLRAFLDGVDLSDFVGEHFDDVFGRQVVENSLLRAIGEELAKKYYTWNQ